jgi:pimeloyl-ACP methyl ester carboxylesterase
LVVGHSSGGWVALELARLGESSAVLALAPAGLWRRRSPRATNLMLRINWRFAHLAPTLASTAVRSPIVRSLTLRTIAAHPARVPSQYAVESAAAAAAAKGIGEHFAQTRRTRFSDGQTISAPVKLIWGERDRIAPAGKSRCPEELPPHAATETWPGCGHMLMWDAPDRLLNEVEQLLEIGAGPGVAPVS